MKSLSESLESLSTAIEAYNESDIHDGEYLIELLKTVTANLFFLEKFRSDTHKAWQSTVNSLILQGTAVNRAENQAHVNHPQMYELRRILESGYKVADAIRSNISFLKSEKHHS